MITICFDEKGDFEGTQVQQSHIAGVYYVDGGQADLDNEKERICKFFETVCNEINNNSSTLKVQFPRDLHSNKDYSNSNKVSLVKNCYLIHLSEFLKKGTYNGKELLENNGSSRKGFYYSFLMYYNQNHSPVLVNGVLDDNNAALRYEQMVRNLIKNILFDLTDITKSNPKLAGLPDINKLIFDLPTRTLKKVKTTRVDYDVSLSQKNPRRTVTNNSSFRTIIDAYLRDNKFLSRGELVPHKLLAQQFTGDFEFTNQDKIKEAAFHYLVDAVNSFFKTYPGIDNYISRQGQLMDADRCRLWCYGRVNQLYMELKELIWENKYFEAYNTINDINEIKSYNPKPHEVDYYIKKWINPVKTEINNTFSSMSPTELRNFAVKINEITYSNKMRDCLDSLETISKDLLEVIKKSKSPGKKNTRLLEAEFYCYDTIVCVYNHKGEPKKSIEIINKIDKLVPDLDDKLAVIRRKNRYVTAFIDDFMYDLAFEQARDAYAMAKFRRGDTEKARALSQFAQITYALDESNCFLLDDKKLTVAQWEKNKQMVSSHFEKSLEIWKDEKDDYNYQFTLNFYLHSIIEEARSNSTNFSNIKKKYLKWSEEYFFNKNMPMEQYKEIMKLDGDNKPFMIQLWLKGVLTFYSINEITAMLQVQDIELILREFKTRHPWESIALYAYELLWILSNKNYKYYNDFYNCLNNFSSGPNVIGCIIEANKISFDSFVGKVPNADMLRNYIKVITDDRLPKSVGDLKKNILYSYR